MLMRSFGRSADPRSGPLIVVREISIGVAGIEDDCHRDLRDYSRIHGMAASRAFAGRHENRDIPMTPITTAIHDVNAFFSIRILSRMNLVGRRRRATYVIVFF